MAGETTATESTVEDDGFDAGFASVGTQTETPEQTTEQQPAAEPAAAAEQPETQAAEPKYVQITEEEWNQVRQSAGAVEALRRDHEQRFDKAFGTVGGLKQIVDGLAKRGVVELSEDDFTELKEEYGEDIAKSIVAGMKRGYQRAAPPAEETRQPAAIQPAQADDIVRKTQSDLIDSRLDEVVDGDWHAEVRTPAFQEWMGKQADDVKSLAASTSVRDAARLLRLWVGTKTAAAPASAPAAAPQAPAKAPARQRVMAAAVNPRGAGARAPASPERDPFDEGFAS